MAWQYFIVCLFDFMLGPLLWSIYHSFLGKELPAWHPLTLEAGGLYHISMGAIVGISAWSRTLEKLQMMKHLTPSMLNSNDPEDVTEETISKATDPPK